MDVEDGNMEQFYVISLPGTDAQASQNACDPKQARRNLLRKILILHLRHALSWLLLGALILSIYLLGRYAMEGAVNGVLGWTSSFLAAWLLWYTVRGHVEIHGEHRAKLYWLVNDAANHEFSSDDPVIATMVTQDRFEPERLHGKSAS
jgi:hypothetical protein